MNNKPDIHKSKLPAPDKVKPAYLSRDRRFVLYHGDCIDLMTKIPDASFDMIFADPPYFLSNNGITCHAGKMVSVNKGKWDQSRGLTENYNFTLGWLAECQRLLKPNGTIWISGTSHIHFIIGFCLSQLGYKILNDIAWVKPNPPPNLSCRYFTHSTEIIWWAAKNKKSRHKFNYALMKKLNNDKQMKSVWQMDAPKPEEKIFGKHPTQKPLKLLERIIAASTDEGDVVLDPFSGSSTTGIASARMNRKYVGMEVVQEFVEMSVRRYELEYEFGGGSLFLEFERKQKYVGV